jgi:hypothetical protein
VSSRTSGDKWISPARASDAIGAARTTDVPRFAFVDIQPTPKVTRFGSRWPCSLDQWDPQAGPMYTDQPLHPGEFSADEEAAAEEFEQAWRRALQARGRR